MSGAPRRGFFSRHGRLVAVLAFFALLIGSVSLLGLAEYFSLASIRAKLLMHPASGFAIFVGLFSLGGLLLIPGWIFLVAAVLALGPLQGGVVTWLAASVACTVTFLVVRQIGGSALREFDSPLVQRVFRQLDTWPVASVLALRLMFQTLPALNVSLALSGVRFPAYLLGTLLGLPLPIAVYCLFFDQFVRFSGIQV